MVSQIERDEAQRLKIVEKIIDEPSRRVNCSLTAHPFKDELIMFGGEFHDGQKTTVYGDMFFYNLNKKIWTVIKAPGAPPPRCGHQALATPNNKGEFWIFGGEFSSPSESQFYHYKDLWVYKINDKKWEKIVAPGGPTSRSGHRMIYGKKQLIVFGGFHDNLRDFKYFNDLHIFDLVSYKWSKIDLCGNIPPPRSGCIVLPTSDNKILIYGGYSKERIKKDVDKGQVHTDMFVLGPDIHDETKLKWKSIAVKQTGIKISPRCSATGILVQPSMAYIFGGVYDNEEDDEIINGTFFNDLLGLDVEKYQWRTVNLISDKEKLNKKRINKQENEHDDDTTSIEVQEPAVTTVDDGIFTVTVGPAPVASTTMTHKDNMNIDIFSPCPRINPALAVKNNNLYLYGGMYEDGDKQITLNDFYRLDLHKLNEWQTIIENDVSTQQWFNSDSSDNTESSDNDDESDTETSENEMDVD